MDSGSLSDLDRARRTVGRRLELLIWLHVPAFLAVSFALGHSHDHARTLAPIGLAFALAASATAIRAMTGGGTGSRLAASVALVSMASLSAVMLADTPWQSDADVHGLACLAILAVFRDWRVLAAAAAAILLQRAGLGLIGWDGADVGIASLPQRAALLLITAAPAIWLTRELEVTACNSGMALAALTNAAERKEAALRRASEEATDLAAQVAEDSVGRKFQDEIGGLVSGLVADAATAAQGVRQAAAQVTEATEVTMHRSDAMTAGSNESLSSAQDVAGSVDRLAASIADVTGQIREVSEVSFRAMDEAGSTNETVQKLADTAGRIGTVVRVINTIARRTNMLALNATIEAARAGEAGRGFSVVASEVKDLARQTATATAEIEHEIKTIQEEMGSAMSAIDLMASTVANLGGISVSVASMMDEQAEMARAIAASAMRVAAGTESFVNNLNVLTEAATRGDEAAREGSRGAEQLADKCGSVEAAVQSFMKTLLAA